MVEFGARLSLKDNMYATLQKNLKMQRQFSEQVKRTSDSVKALAKAKVAPVIRAKDNATSTINKVKNSVKTVGKMVARPFVIVKDGATKVINKITSPFKKLGKMVAKPFVALKDRASPILSKIKGTLKSVGSTVAKPVVAMKDGATAGLSKIKGVLGTLAKGVTIGIAIAGAGASLLLGGSLSEGANLQQSMGGVETLFKGDAGAVKANADMAFKTAGLSANAYMETVTSFSASLLNSLGGDTAKSAQIADMAIIDMADNANKFGTDMESIQNAYQGFAKQNYTMLDNLKLGYGGTKEEMQRLLNDAQKLTGVKYDISNLSEVYSAVHAIQENLGVTGTTADEASKTFSGSFASMKSSAQNLLGNLAIGGDVTGSMKQLVDSASIFLFDNAIPMIGNVIKALPTAISTGIKSASPKIKELGGDIVKSLKEGLMAMLPSSMSGAVGSAFDNIGSSISSGIELAKSAIQGLLPVVENVIGAVAPVIGEIGAMIGRVAPVIVNTLGGAFANSGNFIQTFATMISSAIPVIEGIITGLATGISYVLPVISSLGGMFASVFPSILSVVSTVISTLLPIIQRIAGVIQQIMPIIKTAIEAVVAVFSTAWEIISPVLDVAMSVIEALLAVVEAVFPVIKGIIEDVWGALEPIFSGIADGLSAVADAVGNIAGWVGDKLSGGGGGSGFAYGKDRVPYDNYPARLHQGEKVLTRNQADQYDRQMSTRGVQLNTAVQEVPRDGGTGTSTGGTGQAQEVQEVKKAGTTVNIEKLADTVVIEKEADVDKVVEDMINKFRKLVPNMA